MFGQTRKEAVSAGPIKCSRGVPRPKAACTHRDGDTHDVVDLISGHVIIDLICDIVDLNCGHGSTELICDINDLICRHGIIDIVDLIIHIVDLLCDSVDLIIDIVDLICGHGIIGLICDII